MKPIVNTVRSWLDSDCVILDTETTGLGCRDEIIEICIIDRQGNSLLDTLVRPKFPGIPKQASDVHGILMAELASAPTWGDIYDQVMDILKDRPVVIYNRQYDVRLIEQSSTAWDRWFASQAFDFQCAMLAYAEYYGETGKFGKGYAWQSISKAVEQQGLTRKGNAHRAKADCLATLDILEAMTRTVADSPLFGAVT